MRYIGDVYRPPSEAHSLIVQCTLGCSHNQCAFCYMYKGKPFSIRPLQDVLADLAEARPYRDQVDRIFLADGDALILPMHYLMTVLAYIRVNFPACNRVSAYASTKALLTKSDDDLRRLARQGLSMVYVGLESGDEALLERYQKGVSVEQIIEQSLRVKAAGIALSLTIINGMAGQEGWQEHAVKTAQALSRIKADYIALLTLRVYSGTLLQEWVERGQLALLEPPQLAAETRLLLQNIDSEGSVFRANHASNYLPLMGTLNHDRQTMIEQIDNALRSEAGFRRYVELGR